MSHYKKGKETRDAIIDNAKKLFYIYGYKKVSLSQICLETDIKLGTLTYYFKKKENLLQYIYSNYMNKLETFVQENTDDILPTQFRIYVIMLYYFNIYRDPPAIRFHYELLKDTSMKGILVNSKELIRPFSESCILAQNDEMYDLLVTADNAVRRELNLMYMQNGCNDMADIKELVSKIYTVTGQLFSYDLNLIHQYIDESYDFMLHHIDKRIHLLI